jgi:lysophospholipase L1-like esterase
MSTYEQPASSPSTNDERLANIGDLIETYKNLRRKDPSNSSYSPITGATKDIEFPLDDEQMDALRLRDQLQSLGVHFNMDGEINIANCSEAVQEAIRKQNIDIQ